MQKVPGVTSVKVSLNDGLVILECAPENTVTLAQLRQIIRNNGFVTNESHIVARGTITQAGASAFFDVGGSKERLLLTTSPRLASPDVVVTGTANTKDAKGMTLSVVKIEGR
jgi:copper chaperone CopZ